MLVVGAVLRFLVAGGASGGCGCQLRWFLIDGEMKGGGGVMVPSPAAGSSSASSSSSSTSEATESSYLDITAYGQHHQLNNEILGIEIE